MVISKLRNGFWSVLFMLILIAGCFYYLQNVMNIIGGNIAVVKLLWLASVIWCWYVLPLFLLQDSRLSVLEFTTCRILFANMLIRAIIELFMMYGSKNWDPIYGISHDAFSALLMLFLGYKHRSHKVSKRLGLFLFAYLLIVFFETVFACYIFSLQEPDSIIYFVPNEINHQGILQLTWFAVIASNLLLTRFIWKWLYGKFV